MQQIQARAEQVLEACARVLVPIIDWPRGACSACGRVPDARLSMRLDGVEMFWADVCELHHDETYEVSVS
jgi:hypothetical protein